MPLNHDKILGMAPQVIHQNLTERDVMLYALGIGAEELEFIYEDRLQALPMMAVTLGYPGFIWKDPALGVTWNKILHGEQFLTLHAPLPTSGAVVGTQTFEAIFDKGADKGAIVLIKRVIRDVRGGLLATVNQTNFLRADGGFGGKSDGAPAPHPIPDRAPDAQLDLPTAANQAHIYRLSGDYNPLHIDPVVAKSAGYDKPILHGLCTYGVAGRALLKLLCNNDPTRLRTLNARFSAPVYPGETIRTLIWHEGDGRAAFRCYVVERNIMVLNNGLVEFV